MDTDLKFALITVVGALAMIIAFSFTAVMGIRVSEEEEYEGMDIADCGMEAYPEFVKG